MTKKELIKVENTRLVSMLEKVADFNIELFHLPGIKNSTADILSMHTLPVVDAPEFPRGRRSVLVCTIRSQGMTREDASLWKLAKQSSECQDTREIIEAVKKGLEIK